MEKERAYLEAFKDTEWAVKRLTSELSFTIADNVTILKDEGDPLESFDISGDRGKHLAKVVKECIWKSALAELKGKGLSHHDIHEGNIIISPDLDKVCLVDFESVTPFGKNASHSPTLLGQYIDFSTTSIEADAEFDEISTGALLHTMWNPLVTSLVSPIDGKSANLGRKELLHKYAKSNHQDALIKEIEGATTGSQTGTN